MFLKHKVFHCVGVQQEIVLHMRICIDNVGLIYLFHSFSLSLSLLTAMFAMN